MTHEQKKLIREADAELRAILDGAANPVERIINAHIALMEALCG